MLADSHPPPLMKCVTGLPCHWKGQWSGLPLWGLLGPNYRGAVVFLACGTACPFILNSALTGVLTGGFSLGFGLFVCGLIQGKSFQTACSRMLPRRLRFMGQHWLNSPLGLTVGRGEGITQRQPAWGRPGLGTAAEERFI